MPSLSLSLLGSLAVVWEERPLTTFRTNRIPALLLYLAVEASHPHRREALMELLWPGLPPASARQNLRQTLYLLRKAIPNLNAKQGEGTVPLLISDRHKVQLNPDGDFFLDVAQLEQLLRRQATATQWAEAIALYRGDFLADFYLPDSENFETWVAARRADYRRLVLKALEGLTAVYLTQNNWTEAEKLARRQLEIDNLRESGHRQLLEALAKNGRRHAALAHYETLVDLLQTELAITPSAATKALARTIRADEFGDPTTAEPEITDEAAVPTPPHNLPLPATPFVGRKAELAALERLLADPAARLITIIGAGGMGKTRLALATVEHYLAPTATKRSPSQFADGIYFIPLAGLHSAADLGTTIAQALSFRPQPSGSRTPWQQFLESIKHKQLLLLMDNFEHVLDGVTLVADILQAAPAVKVLATSRERLHLHEEYLFAIQGLTFPASETAAIGAEFANYEAIELFRQSVSHVQHDFHWANDDVKATARICRLVEGMPLALELAASWADVLPLVDIAAEIQSRLDLLETAFSNVPPRHRSVRATLDTSWLRLSEAEQRLLAHLSVFRGGFTRSAGQTIAGASLRLLARLVDKSLLQYDKEHNRYQLHELLRQYGAEKLRERGEETAVCAAHSIYFCQALQKWEPELKGQQQQTALQQIKADEDNIRVAWQWVIEQEKWEYINQAINGLGRFYMLTVRRQEGATVCQEAAKKLMESLSRMPAKMTSTQHTLAKVLAWQANFLLFMGQKETINQLFQQSLTYLAALADSERDSRLVKAHVLVLMGLSAKLYDAEFTVAKTLFDQSLAIYQKQQDEWGTAWALRELGSVQYRLGYSVEAKQSLQRSLLSFQALGDRLEEYWTLRALRGMALSGGKLDESENFDQQSLGLAIEIGDIFGQVNVISDLAWLSLFRGNLNQADSLFKKAIARANNIDYEFYNTILDLRFGQGLVALHRGQYEEAHNIIQTASSLIQEHNLGHLRMHAFLFALLQGCAALVEEAYTKAQIFLDQASHEYPSHPVQHFLVDALAILGIVSVKLNQRMKASQQLRQAMELALELHSFRAASPVVGTALLLADMGHHERALELYTLAESQPMVSLSQWFADIVGKPIAAMAAALPQALVAAAQARGQELEWWQTIKSLTTELQELDGVKNPSSTLKDIQVR